MQKEVKKLSLTRQFIIDGILAAILVLLGMIKLPSLFPGAEFQLSAPYAVCLAYMVGFKRYLGIGICSSIIQLFLGTHTIWNVVIAMVFRIVAGLIVEFGRRHRLAVIAAGPLGTGCARLVIAYMLQVPAWPLLVAAVPGMVFTAVGVLFVIPMVERALKYSGLSLQ